MSPLLSTVVHGQSPLPSMEHHRVMISSSGGCAHLSLPTGDTVYQYSVALFKCSDSIAEFYAKCNSLHNYRILAQRLICAYCTTFQESSNYGCFTKFLHNYFGNRTLVRTSLKYEDNIARLFAQQFAPTRKIRHRRQTPVPLLIAKKP